MPRRKVRIPPVEVVPRESTVGRMRAGAADVEMALDYIRTKACDGIRVEDVANHVYVPLRTLEVQFSAAVGHTVGEEVRSVRLARAKHLLETTELPMSRVADLVGLSSSSALTNFMHRWADITPNAYRKAHRRQ